MGIFGAYRPDRTILDERPAFDELAQPFFHKGNGVGCIVLHGIGGTPANVRVVADRLAADGYTVLAPTLPGHGETVRALDESTGEQWLSCVRAAHDRLAGEGCTRIFSIGLSLGGVLSGLLAAERPLSGLCMLCAPVVMRSWLQWTRRASLFLPFVRYPEETYGSYAQMYGGFSTRKLRDLERLRRRLIRALPAIACPTLLVEAAHDNKVDPRTVPLVRARAINVPRLSVERLENSPHGCTYGLERDRAAELVSVFVRSVLDSAPADSV